MECKTNAVRMSAKQLTAKTSANNNNDCNTDTLLNDNVQQDCAPSKTALLLELIKNEEFFHDEQNNPYITFKNMDHYETWPLDSAKFKEWVSFLFWKNYKKSIHGPAFIDALSVLKGKAFYEGSRCNIFTRVGYSDGKIYINLANKQWQVIEISKYGWKLLEKSPIKFVGSQNMRALPTPVPQRGNFNLLWKHVNIPVESQLLVTAWLLDALLPNTPYPVLLLTGFQGSGKSKTQERLRELIDPSSSNLRNPPKNSDDIITSAQNNYLVSYNNVSKLTAENQDDMCCLATGGGFAKRRLYTNGEEVVFDIKRPIIMNGIGDLINRQDLLDRTITIALPIINTSGRKSDVELDTAFNHELPQIFTGLLDLLVKALSYIPSVNLREKPRMASFAILGKALELSLNLPDGSFEDTYRSNLQESMLSALDSSSVGVAVMNFIKKEQHYKGTYANLLEVLHWYQPWSQGWPKSPKGLSNALKRLAPALNIAGLRIVFEEKPRNDGYHIEIFSL